ncbi:MAG: alpha-ketoglutarate-dependent dioxygenase AlkB family protein [Crocinitomicaceae bacterium]
MRELLNDNTGQIFLIENFDHKRDREVVNWFQVDLLIQDTIKLFGKEYLQPRLLRFEGDPNVSYIYSRKEYVAEPWSPVSKEIRSLLNRYLNAEFNSVLINLYRDGSDSMGLHADNEPELGDCPTIASVSYGAEREIIFKENNGDRKLRVLLQHGSLLIMKGRLQHSWKHEIRKTKKPLAPRLNFTFRRIN